VCVCVCVRVCVCVCKQGYFENQSHAALKVRGFVSTVIAKSLRDGLQSLLCCAGLGVMRPNVLMLGFKENWDVVEVKEAKSNESTIGASMDEYVDMIRDGFKMGMSVMISRNLQKINWDEKISEGDTPEGSIDVYWLVDDGGLTLLVPYILSLHTWWQQHTGDSVKKAPIRLMLTGDLQSNNVIRSLVDQFRVPCEIVELDINTAEVDALEHYKTFSRKAVKKESKLKTEHWLKMGELIKTESTGKAKCIFITCPYPVEGIDNKLYMSWLDKISDTEIPTVLIRGNDDNVLTFYLE